MLLCCCCSVLLLSLMLPVLTGDHVFHHTVMRDIAFLFKHGYLKYAKEAWIDGRRVPTTKEEAWDPECPELKCMRVMTDGAPGQYACRQSAKDTATFHEETGCMMYDLIGGAAMCLLGLSMHACRALLLQRVLGRVRERLPTLYSSCSRKRGACVQRRPRLVRSERHQALGQAPKGGQSDALCSRQVHTHLL
jgi:hypothetical protein